MEMGLRMPFQVTEVRTEYQECPMGLDVECPRFSWKLSRAGEGSAPLFQAAYRISVGTAPGLGDMWDSGKVESGCSIGVEYGGKALLPRTRYYVSVRLWDREGEEADAESWFETGHLNPSIEAWDGAQWIGAPEKYLSAETMGVFVLTGTFCLTEGSKRAGLVFGAKDRRLLDANKNQYGIAGDNFIAYVIDIGQAPAMLEIYRVGYAPGDSAGTPLAAVPVSPYGGGAPLITPQNCHGQHELKVEVIGDCAFAYVDGVLVDAVEREMPFGKQTAARQLNPLGYNDTTTFPRLCEIGYYAGAGDTVHFGGITVSNLREPKHAVACLDGGGRTVHGPKDSDQSVLGGGIILTEDISAHSLPMLRRDFTVKEGAEVAAARLYITARGIYDCRINGAAVTETWFNPGSSQYDKHIMYQAYDVGGLLVPGQNGIGITLASGWWCDAQTFVLSNYNYYGDKESVLARLEITYRDGTKEAFVTNTADWDYYGEGPYTYAGFFQGEHLDGRRYSAYEDFSKPGFSIDGMKKPIEVVPEAIGSTDTMPGFGEPWPALDHSKAQIVGGVNAPVVEVCRLWAKEMSTPREGVYIYDLGQEIAGVPLLTLKGAPGTEVTVRYGEMLYPDLPEYSGLCGMMLTENYRDAESIDRYILRGDEGGEVFCPKFTFHGYRYIEITGVETPPALTEVGSIQLSSVARITGELKTSDALLIRFIENVRWSQYCNFISIPTDCPQRNERMGWAGMPTCSAAPPPTRPTRGFFTTAICRRCGTCRHRRDSFPRLPRPAAVSAALPTGAP